MKKVLKQLTSQDQLEIITAYRSGDFTMRELQALYGTSYHAVHHTLTNAGLTKSARYESDLYAKRKANKAQGDIFADPQEKATETQAVEARPEPQVAPEQSAREFFDALPLATKIEWFTQSITNTSQQETYEPPLLTDFEGKESLHVKQTNYPSTSIPVV